MGGVSGELGRQVPLSRRILMICGVLGRVLAAGEEMLVEEIDDKLHARP